MRIERTGRLSGKTRVVIESFEKWYSNQVKYKKVGGPPPGEELKGTFFYDPRNPARSIGGNAFGVAGDLSAAGPRFQADPDENMLSFVSDALEEELILAGAVSFDLFVASSVPATAFSVKLSEVRADEKTVSIRDDITDVRYISDMECEEYIPGQIRRLEFSAIDIFWKLQRGSKLRFDISSSNFPLYHVHPNTTESWSEGELGPVAEQTVFWGGETPSRIVLHLL